MIASDKGLIYSLINRIKVWGTGEKRREGRRQGSEGEGRGGWDIERKANVRFWRLCHVKFQVWHSLLHVLQDFSDWSQCQVLELVSHYKPASEDEVFDFLNALEDRMTHANSVGGGKSHEGRQGRGAWLHHPCICASPTPPLFPRTGGGSLRGQGLPAPHAVHDGHTPAGGRGGEGGIKGGGGQGGREPVHTLHDAYTHINIHTCYSHHPSRF